MLAPDRVRVWRSNPAAFVEDVFRPQDALDPWQVDVLEYAGSGRRRKRLALQSAAGTAKTCTLAWLGWHRLACYAAPGEHPMGFAASMNGDNLRGNLWKELAKWYARSPMLQAAFEVKADAIVAREAPRTWRLDARTWAKKAGADEQADALSGLHGLFPFALVDESATIHPSVANRCEQMFTGCEDGLIATAGNPTSTTGMLYLVAVKRRAEWHVIEITGDPDDPARSSRVDPDWARARIAAEGESSPWVQAYIFGRFPEGGINQLLSLAEVEEAMRRSPDRSQWEWAPMVLGVDVARQGLDRSVIARRQGLMCWPFVSLRGQDSLQGAGRVAREWRQHKARACFVDATGGFGWGWVDQLRALDFNPIGVQFSEQAASRQFANKRAEMWWSVREWVKQGGALPQDGDLLAELTEPTYGHRRGSDQLIMEDKDRIQERLGRSPDLLDALGLTFAHPVEAEYEPGTDLWGEQRERALRFAVKAEEPPGW